MGAGQREAGKGVVVETHVQPGTGVVACRTTGRESCLYVIGVLRCSEILGVATHAIGGSAFVFAAHMARIAIEVGVRSG